MKIKSLVFLIFIFVSSCSVDVQVKHAGYLTDVMQGKDISAKINLKELEATPHLYAVGALENLRGEVLIFDGYPFISTFKNALYLIDQSFNYKATLLVYSSIESWTSVEIPESIQDMGGLQIFIKEISGPYGLKGKPFPFRIEGEVKHAEWHVVNGVAGNHSESGVSGKIENEPVRILGFFSENHEGVFTHHNSKTHAHILNQDQTISGHLDYLDLGANMVLMIPKE